MQAGKASVQFENPPLILSEGSVAGKKEGQGPLGTLFDRVEQDDKFGKANWEEAESEMQKQAVEIAASKAGLKNEDIRYLLGGDRSTPGGMFIMIQISWTSMQRKHGGSF